MPSKQTKTSIETYHIQTSEDKARENLEGSQTKKTKTDQKKKNPTEHKNSSRILIRNPANKKKME